MSTLSRWKKDIRSSSENLTTNARMPAHIQKRLLQEDVSARRLLVFDDVHFSPLQGWSKQIKGLAILSGLQKFHKKGCLTVYRAIRFPTYTRLFEMVSEKGFAVPNYEQERILELYKNPSFIKQRKFIKKKKWFWTMPQERVVNGLPVFSLVNDAIQIHRAFRSVKDRVALVVMHIPHTLFKKKQVQLIANAAIDLDYDDGSRDVPIQDFAVKKDRVEIRYDALRARGVDLHEMYAQGLAWTIQEANQQGIEQQYFLLDIYRIQERTKKLLKRLKADTKTLLRYQYFLHGIFGDQNIFGRRDATYLPLRCRRVSLK